MYKGRKGRREAGRGGGKGREGGKKREEWKEGKGMREGKGRERKGRRQGKGSFPKICVPCQFLSLVSPSSHLILLSAIETSKANDKHDNLTVFSFILLLTAIPRALIVTTSSAIREQ